MTQKDTISTILMCLVYGTNGDILPFDIIVKKLHAWIKLTGYIPSERGGLYNKQYIQTFECGGRKDLSVILTYSDVDSVMISRVEDVIKEVLQNINPPTCGEPAKIDRVSNIIREAISGKPTENKKEPMTKILELPVYQYMTTTVLAQEVMRLGNTCCDKDALGLIKYLDSIGYKPLVTMSASTVTYYMSEGYGCTRKSFTSLYPFLEYVTLVHYKHLQIQGYDVILSKDRNIATQQLKKFAYEMHYTFYDSNRSCVRISDGKQLNTFNCKGWRAAYLQLIYQMIPNIAC